MKEIIYEVWGLGYDSDGFALDNEEYLGEFDNAEAAIEHAKKFIDLSYVYDEDIMKNYIEPDETMEIRVEKVNTQYWSCEEVIYAQLIEMPEVN